MSLRNKIKQASNSIYNDDFFKGHAEYAPTGVILGKKIAKYFNIKSIVDFGCGVGCYINGFQASGAKVRGYELAFDYSKKYTDRSICPYITKADVSAPINAGCFHASMSIEVAEHISTKYSDALVENLCSASNECNCRV